MPKMFPIKQVLVDAPDGEVTCITKVKALGTNENYLVLPSIPTDARILLASGQSAPAFYLGQASGTGTTVTKIFNIDGTSAGSEFLVVSRHTNIKNSGGL